MNFFLNYRRRVFDVNKNLCEGGIVFDVLGLCESFLLYYRRRFDGEFFTCFVRKFEGID